MPKSLVPNQFDYAGIYVEGKRSQFGFHKVYSSSFMAGMLIPLGDPVSCFPGTRLDLKAMLTVRSNTLLAVPLDGMYLDVFSVWVPHRIVWSSMPQFLGENDTTAWTQSVQLTYPSVKYQAISNSIQYSFLSSATIQGDIVAANNFIAPHYGLLSSSFISSGYAIYDKDISVLSIRGYYSAWNHYWRDENYQRPVLFSKTNTGSSGEFGYLVRDYNVNAGTTLSSILGSSTFDVSKAVLMPVNKFHDAFTSLLPQPQFGDPSLINLGTEAPIRLEVDDPTDYTANQIYGLTFQADGVSKKYDLSQMSGDFGSSYIQADGNPVTSVYFTEEGSSRLYADLSTATASTINQLRASIMYQRYLEALARGGRRVVEYYQNIYGIKNSEAAKDYPQMLSHQRYILGVNQVVATADSSGSGWSSKLGDTGAFSLTNLRDVPICQFEASEFGYLHIFYCVRADNRYSQSTPEHFFRKELLDEYNPYFDHIGDVAVPSYMVNNKATTDTNFGFQEAWWFERSQTPGITAGALNKDYGSLSFWILGEKFPTSLVTCTPGYLCFDPAVFNDVMAAPYYSDYQFIIDSLVYGKKAGRMSQHSIPGIVGRI